jgi:hypothetical protein
VIKAAVNTPPRLLGLILPGIIITSPHKPEMPLL